LLLSPIWSRRWAWVWQFGRLDIRSDLSTPNSLSEGLGPRLHTEGRAGNECWGSLTTRHMQDSNLHISTFTRIL
jgi:hypothetical protein